MKEISRKEAVELIYAQKDEGVFFTVIFVKRTTGELRLMNCRGGVQKYVKGVGLAFDPEKKALITVWEANNAEGCKGANAYRHISIEGIREVHAGGEKYKVVD